MTIFALWRGSLRYIGKPTKGLAVPTARAFINKKEKKDDFSNNN